ncbi:hypothetical protein DH2020_028576 [Rehmannia glutinosa]|uniref:Phytocyanin domain-containing protein n=1 Tax=Rehmannia glutinosa TaxID=99300 RepID=A0ABR0VV26_REHGL
MASKAFLIAITVVGIAAPKAFATDYVVDWALGVNYTAWAEGKDFYVGDRLTIADPTAFATDYVVGDLSGWTLGVNYTAWAEGKEFYVGDRLSTLID